MIIIPAIVIAVIYLMLKILVPTILIIALIVLLCIYFKNRGQGEGDLQERMNANIDSVKEKATNAWEKIKFVKNFLNNKKETEQEEELKEV